MRPDKPIQEQIRHLAGLEEAAPSEVLDDLKDELAFEIRKALASVLRGRGWTDKVAVFKKSRPSKKLVRDATAGLVDGLVKELGL